MAKIVMSLYAFVALTVTVVGLAAMLIAPPSSTRVDRDGVAYFTPKVENPATGKGVSLNVLIRNYRGD